MVFLLILIFQFDTVKAGSTTMNGDPKTKESEVNGSTFIQYISTCKPNADDKPLNFKGGSTTWKKMDDNFVYKDITGIDYDTINKTYDASKDGKLGNFIFSERSIIYPKGLTQAKRIYIYWHGIGWDHHTTQEMCNGKGYTEFCARSAQMGDSVIIAPRTLNTGSQNQLFTTDEIKCLFDEAKNILKTKNVSIENAEIIILGHSGGGNPTEKSLLNNASWSGSNRVIAAMYFDSSYGDWAKTALSSSHLQVPLFIYYSQSGTQKKYIFKDEKDGYNLEWRGAQDAKIFAPDRVKILETKNPNHNPVINQCFLDHLDGKGCTGGSFIPLNYTAEGEEVFINNFQTIYGDAVAQINNNIPRSTQMNLTDELKTLITEPQLQIRIPGLNFKEGVSLIKEGDTVYLQNTLFQQYLVAIYKYSVVAISILGVVMIIFAGIQWLISGGSPDKINSAKKRISGSIIGIVLAVGSYTILYTINPYLTGFRSLQTQYFNTGEEEYDDANEPNAPNGTADFSLSNINITGDFSQDIYPVTKDSYFDQKNNFGKRRKVTTTSNLLRCHAGVDIYTKPPGIVVSATDGEVIYVTNQFMAVGSCKGTEAGENGPWKNASVSLKYGMAGGIMIYDKSKNLSYWYGEINETSIMEFIEKYKNKLGLLPKSPENKKQAIQTVLNTKDPEMAAARRAASQTGEMKYRYSPKPGQTIEIKKGDILGVASRCGMLHFEVYEGRMNEGPVGLDWKPAGELFSSASNEANYCVTKKLYSNKPSNLINSQEVLDKLKNNMVNAST